MAKPQTKAKRTVSSNDQTDRKRSLDDALTKIRKDFGEGAIMTLDSKTKFNTPAISTGVMALDVATGIGGVPRGRIVELFGPESGGKTTLSLNVVSEAQKKGGVAAFIDAEHAFDPAYATKIGVKLNDLLISQPDTGEQALDITEVLVKSNAVDLIVLDSVAALVPRAEIEGEMGQSHIGLQARLMSHALRKLTAIISKSKTCVIFINQLREKVGVVFGNPEVTPGGRALKFYSSMRLEIRRIATLKRGDEAVGNRVRCKVVKNKVAAPFRQAEFDLLFTEGVSSIGSVLDMASSYDVIRQSGSWMIFGDEKLGQGKENARLYLKENPKMLREIEKRIHDHLAQMSS